MRIGLTRPGSTRPAVSLWQRLYLRPLPHQQGSLDLRAVARAVFTGGASLLDQFDESAEGRLRVEEGDGRAPRSGPRLGVDRPRTGTDRLVERLGAVGH